MGTRPFRSLPVAFALAGIVVAAPGCSDDGGEIRTADPTTPTSRAPGTSTTGASTTTTPTDADGQLVVIRTTGGTTTAVLYDPGADRTIRTLLTKPAPLAGLDAPQADAVTDADLAPDGTVFLVTVDTSKPLFGNALVVVDPAGAATTPLRYVTSIELSPDGSQLAYTVLSPDGDDPDTDGTLAVRMRDVATGGTRELWSSPFPTDGSGNPTAEIPGTVVEAWTADGSGLVISTGCCDSGDVFVVPSDLDSSSPTAAATWQDRATSGVSGDHATRPIGVAPDGAIYVQRTVWEPDADDVYRVTAHEVVTLDPRTGTAGATVHTQPGEDGDVDLSALVGTELPGGPIGSVVPHGGLAAAVARFGDGFAAYR